MRLPVNVFEEYKARRLGIIRALTVDVSRQRYSGHAHCVLSSFSGVAIALLRALEAVHASVPFLKVYSSTGQQFQQLCCC